MNCRNGGILSENKTYCICPDLHVAGVYCETLLCENGGKDSKLGYCICPDRTVRTRYCEKEAPDSQRSTFLMLTVPLGAFALLAILCLIVHCGKRCKRRRNRSRNRTPNAPTNPTVPAYEETLSHEERNILLRYSDLPPQYSPPPTYERAVRAYISISLGNVLVPNSSRRRMNRLGTDEIDSMRESPNKLLRPQRLYYSKSHRTDRMSFYGVGLRQRSRSL